MKVLFLLLLSPLQGRLSCFGMVSWVWAAGSNWQPQSIGWGHHEIQSRLPRSKTSHRMMCLWWVSLAERWVGLLCPFQGKEMVSIHPFWEQSSSFSVC